MKKNLIPFILLLLIPMLIVTSCASEDTPEASESNEGSMVPSAMIEIKSSHNLLCPKAGESLCQGYNIAFGEQISLRLEERSAGWKDICHPFGLLFGYIVENNVHFGALCSASNTYFAFFERVDDSDAPIVVKVTGAWCTADRDYLRAWACFLREAERYCKEIKGSEPLKDIIKTCAAEPV